MNKQFKAGQMVRGRFGTHTYGASPDWQPWKDHTIAYTQPMKGDAMLVVIEDSTTGHYIEFCTDYIDELSDFGTFVDAEETIFQFNTGTEEDES